MNTEEQQLEAKVDLLARQVQEELGKVQLQIEDVRAQQKLLEPEEPLDAEVAKAPPAPKYVFTEIHIRGLYKLNTLEQEFGVKLTVVMQWECPEDETPPTPETDDGDWVPEWTPKYKILNQMSELGWEKNYTVINVNGQQIVQYEGVHSISVYEQLEMMAFPADFQDLNIDLVARTPIDKVIFQPPRHHKSGELGRKFARIATARCNVNDFMVVDECPIIWHMTATEDDGRSFARANVTIKMQRIPIFYILNGSITCGVLTASCLVIWALHPADVGDRHDMTLMLMIAVVALLSSIKTLVPQLSYNTSLDNFLLLQFFTVAGVAICHSVVPGVIISLSDISPLSLAGMSHDEEDLLVMVDWYCFWGFVVWILLLNIGWFTQFYYRKSSRKAAYIADSFATQKAFDSNPRNACMKRD